MLQTCPCHNDRTRLSLGQGQARRGNSLLPGYLRQRLLMAMAMPTCWMYSPVILYAKVYIHFGVEGERYVD